MSPKDGKRRLTQAALPGSEASNAAKTQKGQLESRSEVTVRDLSGAARANNRR